METISSDRKTLFEKSVHFAHLLIRQKVQKGDAVIDATCGNGNDTAFLSGIVGEQGKVFAFDIQPEAIENTRTFLAQNQCADNVTLICDGHQNMDAHISEKIRLVVFNLGYLPKSDRQCVTQAETTLTAIEKSLELLDAGGLVLVVIYPGHEEGMHEKQQIYMYAKKLSQEVYNVFYWDLINQANYPPVLLGIEKR